MKLYDFIMRKGVIYALHESDPISKELDKKDQFELMPTFSPEERAQRREENNAKIENLIDASWNAEKARRKLENPAPNPKWKKQARKAFIAAHPKKQYSEKTKTEWEKRVRPAIRKSVENEFPLLAIDDFKSPLENKVVQDVVFIAYNQFKVPEEILDMFLKRLSSLRKSSKEAADVFFMPFAKDPSMLQDFALVQAPKKNVHFPSIQVSHIKDLMKERIFSPRNTGKGELGAFALFAGELELLTTAEKGDFAVNRGTPEECIVEVKSIDTRSRSLRLGAEITWAESNLFKWLMTTPLKNTELKKFVTKGNLAKNVQLLKASGMTVEQFIEKANEDLHAVLSKYEKLFVYIEDEEVFEEVLPQNTHFFGISTEGRWKFTIGPNTLFQSL